MHMCNIMQLLKKFWFTQHLVTLNFAAQFAKVRITIYAMSFKKVRRNVFVSEIKRTKM